MENLLFLHGWGGDENSFASVLPYFRTKYNCVCVKMPREISDTPSSAPRLPPLYLKGELPREMKVVWDLDDYADYVIAELDKLEIKKTHIIAHSFGARVAVLLVTKQPERFGKLVLTGPAGIRPRLGLWRRLRVRLHKLGLVASRGSADYRELSPAGKKTFQNIVNRDLSAEIARIENPTLVIWGARDRAIKKTSVKRWTKLQRGVILKTYRRAGHFCFLDEPARFIVDAEEFLNAE